MSDLPTLYAVIEETSAGRVIFWHAFSHKIDADEYVVSPGPGTRDGSVHEYVPAARLEEANLEIARLRLALDAEHRRCVAVVHDVAQKHRKPDGTRTVEGYGALDAWDALASAKPDVFRTITPKELSDV